MSLKTDRKTAIKIAQNQETKNRLASSLQSWYRSERWCNFLFLKDQNIFIWNKSFPWKQTSEYNQTISLPTTEHQMLEKENPKKTRRKTENQSNKKYDQNLKTEKTWKTPLKTSQQTKGHAATALHWLATTEMFTIYIVHYSLFIILTKKYFRWLTILIRSTVSPAGDNWEATNNGIFPSEPCRSFKASRVLR